MEEEFTKKGILESIKLERESLEEQLEGLSDEQMLLPTLEAGWSIKDILAHIVSWERLMVQWLEATMRGEVPVMLPPGLTWDDLDTWNDQMYEENKDLSVEEARSIFDSSYQIAFEKVTQFSEDDLVDPQRFEWRNGRPLAVIVAANTYWHYKEHREQIQNWRTNQSI